MTTARQWIDGARPRTLPAALAPVAVGTGVAAAEGTVIGWRALTALFVALALQIGVNYANDYSDGIRGTDADRVGPFRLVGSGAASPGAVKTAAWACFAAAAVAGLALAAVTTWWLIAIGAAAIGAAWFYTGGSRPYGYRALGELSVFVFFGLVAVVGTSYVQLERVTWLAVLAAVPVGLLACALLVANNLRDIPTDGPAGKRTLAVLLGDQASRRLYGSLLIGSFLFAVLIAVLWTPSALLALGAVPLAVRPIRATWTGANGRALIPVLRDTARLQLAYGLLLAVGLMLSS
ncbi:MAG TPA: 1,4-dihydroxy-2-naphthoate polyprenyltransferase [Actinomycetes bacterium]|nr:1,4-dihydroxy-2-naphthoate polyprenyltransferase [Actinomycetes bacterium]